jgi:DNA-binding transcriptional ArsR family regulator
MTGTEFFPARVILHINESCQTGIIASPAVTVFQKFHKNCACKARAVARIVNRMVKCSPRLLNRTFAALADPTRRRILEHLAHGDQCVTDLARPYAMSLPAVSKHVRVLEKAGLIRRRRQGRLHRVNLEAAPMKQAAQWIEEYRRFWEQSLDRLEEYLKELQTKEKKHEHKK